MCVDMYIYTVKGGVSSHASGAAPKTEGRGGGAVVGKRKRKRKRCFSKGPKGRAKKAGEVGVYICTLCLCVVSCVCVRERERESVCVCVCHPKILQDACTTPRIQYSNTHTRVCALPFVHTHKHSHTLTHYREKSCKYFNVCVYVSQQIHVCIF